MIRGCPGLSAYRRHLPKSARRGCHISGRYSDSRITLSSRLPNLSASDLFCGDCPRLQRRARLRFARSSLFILVRNLKYVCIGTRSIRESQAESCCRGPAGRLPERADSFRPTPPSTSDAMVFGWFPLPCACMSRQQRLAHIMGNILASLTSHCLTRGKHSANMRDANHSQTVREQC